MKVLAVPAGKLEGFDLAGRGVSIADGTDGNRVVTIDGNHYTLEPDGWLVLFPQPNPHNRTAEVHTAEQFTELFDS